MKKTTLLTLTMRLLLLFPIFTTLDFIPGINTMLAVVSFSLIIILILKKGITRRSLVLLLSVALSTLISFGATKEEIIHVNEMIYLGYMCAFFILIGDNRQEVSQFFKDSTQYIKGICIIWNLVVLASMPMRSSYVNGVFVSFARDTFRLSPSALFVLTLSTVLIVMRGSKNIVQSIVPMLAILLGASRTYLLLGGICLAVNLYFTIKSRRMFFLALGLMGVISVIIVFSSAMGEKILSTFAPSSYLTPMQVFTNGRSNFWVVDLQAYARQPILNQLLGCGYNFIRITNGANLSAGSNGIWAHNDFLQVLITNGVFGLGIYFYAMGKLFRIFLNKKMSLMLRIAVVFIWFFNAFFNMYYVYTCAMLSYPVLLLAINEGYLKKNQLCNI